MSPADAQRPHLKGQAGNCLCSRIGALFRRIVVVFWGDAKSDSVVSCQMMREEIEGGELFRTIL